jgi:hypothetical protein
MSECYAKLNEVITIPLVIRAATIINLIRMEMRGITHTIPIGVWLNM